MSSTKNKIAFLICFFALSQISLGQEHEIQLYKTPLSTFFESSVYQGGIQNWRFDQDSSNILYVANSFGLLEFDGERWNRYEVPKSTKTRALYIDNNNIIFVGSQGQLGYFNLTKNGLVFTSLLDKLPEAINSIDEVWNIYEFKNSVHFQTSNGLFKFENSLLKNVLPNYTITGSFPLNGGLLVQEATNQLYQWNGDTLIPYSSNKVILEKVVGVISQKSYDLVFCENGQTIEITLENGIKERKDLTNLFAKPLINVAVQLSSGDIAIGTQNDGLFILDPNLKIKRHLTKNQGIDHRTVYSVYEDHFKNIWVGLNNGISYIELGSQLSLINEEVGLEGTGHTALMHKNKLFLGTNNGLFTHTATPSSNHYELVPGSEGIVYGLTEAYGKLLMTHHTGAYEVENNQIHQFFKEYGSWKLARTPKLNKLIGGTYHGFSVFKLDGNSWNLEWNLKNFDESSRIFEWENDSVLWMTHGYKGAFRIVFNETYSKVKKIKQYGFKDGFPSNLLISVYKLEDRLIFTSEEGIYEYDTTEDKFVINEFLTNWFGIEHVSKITPFGDGHMLFIAKDELGMLNQTAFGKYEKHGNIFKRINKYLSNDLENINVIDEKNVLIGAKEGFIHFDPSLSFSGEQSYNTLIRSVTITGGSAHVRKIPANHFEESHLTRSDGLKFEFASPYFDGFEDIQFSYRLTPYEREWSDWSGNNTKEYTNLPAGQYTFEVKALNIYGIEGKSAKTSFRIRNPWYKSNFAYVTYFSLAVLLFGFISFLQDRKYRAEKEKLSQSKEYALKEKDEELSELTEKSKKEIEDLKNQKLKSEIHHKNNQLASVTMHLINKNEFVQEVRKKIDHMLRDKTTSTEELKKIIKTIDQNHTQDDSWDQFAYHFDQVHGDFLKKLVNDIDKLTPQETKLAAYLRMNMSSKEIANLMGISVRGVELARYRLRKKLGLDRDQNLNDYLMQV